MRINKHNNIYSHTSMGCLPATPMFIGTGMAGGTARLPAVGRSGQAGLTCRNGFFRWSREELTNTSLTRHFIIFHQESLEEYFGYFYCFLVGRIPLIL